MATRNEIGRAGEAAARRCLEAKGYRILQQNWHWHHYELDIVAATAEELVFVEVKTRGEAPLVDPEEAIDPGKIRRIVAAADAYMQRFPQPLPARFDVVLVSGQPGAFRIDHLEDAFYAPCH